MVLEMLHRAKKARNSFEAATLAFETSVNGNRSPPGHVYGEDLDHRKPDRRPLLSYEIFCRDKKILKLEAEAKELLDVLIHKLQRQVELITTEHGILQPTERLYVLLVKAFLEAGRTKNLAEFLIKAQKESSPISADSSTLVHVINSCISLGWLDQAHDLLEEMRSTGIRACSSVYANLLKAYCKENQAGEVTSLLRDARKSGIQLDASYYETLIESWVLEKDTEGALCLFKEKKEAKIHKGGHNELEMLVKGCVAGGEPGLMSKLLQEIKEGQKN